MSSYCLTSYDNFPEEHIKLWEKQVVTFCKWSYKFKKRKQNVWAAKELF